MDEKHRKYQIDKKSLNEVHKCIIGRLESTIKDLEYAGEEYEGYKMWYLVPGTPGNKIRMMIHQLQQMINEIDNVIPELIKKKNNRPNAD